MQKISATKACRLDVFLSEVLNESRAQIANLIKNSCVFVNDRAQEKPSFKLKINDEIAFKKPPQEEKGQIHYPVDFDIKVLFEDEDVLVLNKPPNLTVHGASSVKEATLIDFLMAKNYALSTLGGKLRAGLVHRLDKGTSGAIIIAKNNAAHQHLSTQLQERSMGRFYLALVDLPLKDNALVEKPLARNPHNRLKKLAFKLESAPKGAKMAKSAFINLLSSKDFSLIAAKLFTGRTHQIRAHLESLNRHILGDTLYGYKAKFKGRVMLHAYFIYFLHPKTQEKICIKAPFYDDFNTILKSHFTQGEIDEKTSLEFISSSFDAFI